MGLRGRSGGRAVWCSSIAALLAGCHSGQPADAPVAQSKPASKQASSGGADGSFKDDAMEHMAFLVSSWALLGSGSKDAEPATGWHRHAASGTCMPTGSRSWQSGKAQTYGPDDESVTLMHEPLQILVTLYTYPATKPLQPEFEGVVSTMASKTCTEGPVMSSKIGEAHVGACPHRIDNGVVLLEQVVLLQRGKWFHKARITFAGPATAAAYTPAMSVVSQAFAACPAGAT